ncbi:hypothetical protein KEJ34_02080 [Candidatus Bathyarchaeota archaeon]|nr:hypothetical protein [Candidatus Bathyarchaeota archaeon]
MIFRGRTPICIVLYGVYLVFEGLGFRAASRALEAFTRRSHVSMWRWFQKLPTLRGSLPGWEGSLFPGG